MNIKNFIRAAAISSGLLFFPVQINNSNLYSKEELVEKIIFSTNLYELEQMMMVKSLLLNEDASSLNGLIEKIMQQDRDLFYKIQKEEKHLAELTLKKIRRFSRKRASREEHSGAMRELDSLARRIDIIKKVYDVDFVSLRKKNYASIPIELIPYKSSLTEKLSLLSKLEFLDTIKDDSSDYGNNTYKLIETLKKLAQDAEFIRKAADSGIPLEEIIARYHIESGGRRRTVSRIGAINTSQINPNSDNLPYIYLVTAYQKNDLGEFIREQSSYKRFLRDLVMNSRLNIAVGVNFESYLKDETNNYYEYVISYNRGIEGTLSLPRFIKIKLAYPERISGEDTKKHHPLRYYTDFLNSIKTFNKLKEMVKYH